MGSVWRVAWYRFRASLGRRWRDYLALVLLIGLLGGIAMGSIAAGRRTQSAYPKFLASTNPSDLAITFFGISNVGTPYSAKLTNEISHLAGVRRVESVVFLNGVPLGPNGAPRADIAGSTAPLGSVDGLYFNQDRVTVVGGRMADPTRADEVVMDADTAHGLGLQVGQVFPIGFYSSAQINSAGFGTPSVPPQHRIDAKLVAVVRLNNQVVQDDVDRVSTSFILFTPALTRGVVADSGGTIYGVQLVHGGGDVAAAERAFIGLLPPNSSYNFQATSRATAQVERAVRPAVVALDVFGVIAALAALLIAILAIARQLSMSNEDLEVLRALGAGPAGTITGGLMGILGAVVVGSMVAAGVAVALSPLSPLGPVRPVYPTMGIALDWTVLGAGLLALSGGLGGAAFAFSYMTAPHRWLRRSAMAPTNTSRIVRAATFGQSAPGVVGVRFALQRGRGRTAAPVRSALLGTAVAVVVVVATLTFGSSLNTLLSRPALYGWNWDFALNPSSNVPPPALQALAHDPAVEAWTGVTTANAQIDGQNLPIILGEPNAAPSPPILSGHAVAGNDQVVLGAATLARLHKHVGDAAVLTYGTPATAPIYVPPTRVVIVGTATLPAVGPPSFFAEHTSMGTGALVPIGIEPAAFKQAQVSPDPNQNGPNLVFVRMRRGVSRDAGLGDMQRIADVANSALAADPQTAGSNVTVLGVQHPAEIVNFRSVGATPIVLAAGLAAGATVALGLTLAASVRRHRRDLALLKALGFTKRQLTAAVAWQASVAAVAGTIVGVPLGIGLGGQLWILFARSIDAVPEPTIPVLSVILVAGGALLFANLVAALPGRVAARTPAALVLRAQ